MKPKEMSGIKYAKVLKPTGNMHIHKKSHLSLVGKIGRQNWKTCLVLFTMIFIPKNLTEHVQAADLRLPPSLVRARSR